MSVERLSGEPGPRRWAAVGGVLLLLGGAVIGAMWLGQRQLVYFPDRSAPGPAADALPGAEDVTLATDDGLELGAWFVPQADRDPGAGAVLLAPGNGGNRASRAGLARELSDRGLAVLLLEYRGYGGNPGRPSEAGLALDADAAVAELERRGFGPERTVFLGESLGTGVVAALQARHRPAAVVLRSPFPDLAAVGRHHYPWLPVRTLLRDRFPVEEHLSGSQVPVTVLYGERDQVVPPALSRRVAASVGNLVEETVVSGADHNDPVMFGPEVAEAVARAATR